MHLKKERAKISSREITMYQNPWDMAKREYKEKIVCLT